MKSYDVAIKADPATKTISGTTVMVAKTTIPTIVIQIDLDSPFKVSSVTDGKQALRYERSAHTLRVFFPQSKQPGDEIKTVITYSGQPRIAKNAPWDSAMVWSKAADGGPWFSVSLEDDGADLLFPCKDHPSDRPDQVTMRLTVPEPLVAVGPGKLVSESKNDDRTKTWTWHMSMPIANYCVVFNAGPYKLVHDKATSIDGTVMPIDFYVLPEHMDKAPKLIEEQKKYLAFMEKYCGPYPFRTEKLGIVETPHLGMEHSTAIAYGNQFRFAPDGLDWLLLHEFGHEWWANLVTAADWRDMWIHEGFQSYMDTLYQEHTHGKAAYLEAMKGRARATENKMAVAPRESKTSGEIYTGDIYGKGACILHALRYLVGDAAFFRSVRRMAYPTPESEKWTDGRAERLVTTDDYLSIAERESGRKLDWFFEVYLRQPALPVLKTKVEGGTLSLEWVTPGGLLFPMPVDVEVDGKRQRVEMPGGKGSIKVGNATPVVDPDGWVLKAKG
ncbi:MAG: M1 family metallopeptidase [Armatimonadetes bacterium]|nr:M1 family metallopeptidase [Armatimonadota bacterium]